MEASSSDEEVVEIDRSNNVVIRSALVPGDSEQDAISIDLNKLTMLPKARFRMEDESDFGDHLKSDNMSDNMHSVRQSSKHTNQPVDKFLLANSK